MCGKSPGNFRRYEISRIARGKFGHARSAQQLPNRLDGIKGPNLFVASDQWNAQRQYRRRKDSVGDADDKFVHTGGHLGGLL